VEEFRDEVNILENRKRPTTPVVMVTVKSEPSKPELAWEELFALITDKLL